MNFKTRTRHPPLESFSKCSQILVPSRGQMLTALWSSLYALCTSLTLQTYKPRVFQGDCFQKKKKKSCLGHEVLVCWLKSGGIMGSWVCAFIQIPFLGGVTLNKTWPQVSTSSLRSQPLRADMRSSGGLLWLGDGGLAASGY